ncbi:MAG: hypothetical protein GY832_34090 [Chloroflexi bacterium]|nr:hypothetical protein [Chloroflexota bacterium]
MFNKLWKSAGSISLGGLPGPNVYRRYRVDSRTLSHKIIETTLSKAAMQFAARTLGMMGRDNVMVFDNEDETSVLMDCSLYEHKSRGKNAVQQYQEEIGGETDIERELLAAMVASSTSLFRVESVSKKTYSLKLDDLVNEGHTITLMDINFSQNMKPNYLLFIRPVTLENFSMTSGFAFIFPGHLESELLKRWRGPQSSGSRRRRRRAQPTSTTRYATFFKLSKRKGVKVMYQDVDESNIG